MQSVIMMVIAMRKMDYLRHLHVWLIVKIGAQGTTMGLASGMVVVIIYYGQRSEQNSNLNIHGDNKLSLLEGQKSLRH
jgi:hypothetical protein